MQRSTISHVDWNQEAFIKIYMKSSWVWEGSQKPFQVEQSSGITWEDQKSIICILNNWKFSTKVIADRVADGSIPPSFIHNWLEQICSKHK